MNESIHGERIELQDRVTELIEQRTALSGVLRAIASSPAYAYPRAYYPVAGYEAYPAYAAAPAYTCPGGYWARRPIRDPYGVVVGWSRPRFFCPAAY